MSVRAHPAILPGSLSGSIQAFTCSFPRITGILSWMKRMDSAGFLVRTVKTGILICHFLGAQMHLQFL